MSGREYNQVDNGDRLKLNLVRSVIDAACAQISTHRTRPDFLTIKGDYTLRKRAENLGRFINGQFYASKVYQTSLEVFRDACIFGTGFQKIFEDGGIISSERVVPSEIIVDEDESKYGDPLLLFQHKEINRDHAISLFPEHRGILTDAGIIGEESQSSDSLSDPVSIVEAWHLPSRPDGNDGRHVVCCSTGTLVDEKYTRDVFPFAAFRWSTGVLGFLSLIHISEPTRPY